MSSKLITLYDNTTGGLGYVLFLKKTMSLDVEESANNSKSIEHLQNQCSYPLKGPNQLDHLPTAQWTLLLTYLQLNILTPSWLW